jgi:two-component system copper resistance phosphate regulon response regulator CusR
MRLLLIEDNDRLRETLASGLRAQSYHVDTAADGLEGWRLASEAAHDLIILDRMMPGLDGIEVLRRLRTSGSSVPVLLLTARDAVDDRVAGLDAGADDYLTKPFAVNELLARLRTLLRRGQHRADPVVVLDDLEVDTVARAVRRGGRRLHVTPKEYALIDYLLARPGEVISRAELARQLYDDEGEASANAVEVLVMRLRRKLHPPGAQSILHTRRGFGYQLGGEP